MDWTDDYKMLMREAGREPFGCLAASCGHVSRTFFGMMIHHRFGVHE
jgi:hypothetical protein